MKCNVCHKDKCTCGSSSQSIMNEIAALNDTVSVLSAALQPFLLGHPMFHLENTNDIALFDMNTGLGSGIWLGWGVCNGKTYPSPSGGFIKAPNLIDRTLVQAGGSYAVDDIQGADNVTLTTAQLPAHNHGVNDPGHNHTITDPGHTHGIVDPGHTHAISGGSHTHTLPDHSHELNPAVASVDNNSGTGPFGPAFGALSKGTNYSGLNTNGAGLLTTNATAPVMTAAASPVGVSTQSAFTGITSAVGTTGITTQNTGSGTQVDIRNKSYACLVVMKL